MNLHDLLLSLGRFGVELARDGDRLRFKPMDISAHLIGGLRDHKADLLALLAPGGLRGLVADPDGGYVLGERLGVADGLGLDTGPGSPGWMIVVAEAMDQNDPSPIDRRAEAGDRRGGRLTTPRHRGNGVDDDDACLRTIETVR